MKRKIKTEHLSEDGGAENLKKSKVDGERVIYFP